MSGKGTNQTVTEPSGAAIVPSPVLDIEVENSCRHGPAQSEMASEFSAGIVGDEQHPRVSWIGWLGAKFAPPLSDYPARSELTSHQAQWSRQFALLVGSAEFELEVDEPDLSKLCKHGRSRHGQAPSPVLPGRGPPVCLLDFAAKSPDDSVVIVIDQ